jgi:hypothetical protein
MITLIAIESVGMSARADIIKIAIIPTIPEAAQTVAAITALNTGETTAIITYPAITEAAGPEITDITILIIQIIIIRIIRTLIHVIIIRIRITGAIPIIISIQIRLILAEDKSDLMQRFIIAVLRLSPMTEQEILKRRKKRSEIYCSG